MAEGLQGKRDVAGRKVSFVRLEGGVVFVNYEASTTEERARLGQSVVNVGSSIRHVYKTRNVTTRAVFDPSPLPPPPRGHQMAPRTQCVVASRSGECD